MPTDSYDVFLYVTGAGSNVGTPALIRALLNDGARVNSVLTPNAAMVRDPEELMRVPGNHWIRDYGQTPLDVFPFGIQLIAPCTFNTLNKVAQGIADSLATSMIGDALGAGYPVVIAPGMNQGQWSNPRVALSLEQLTSWGCDIVPPRSVDRGGQMRLTLASVDDIVSTVANRHRRGAV